MNHKLNYKTLTAAALAAIAFTSNGHTQSADALIDKLVEKGILSVKEANELREETDKNFTQAYSIKSGMPEWVTSLKFNGDVRLREESHWTDSQFAVPANAPVGTEPQGFVSRNRFRYRFRFGVVATLFENFEVGLRLTSADPASGGSFGGNPVSGNTTFQDNASRKFIYIDQAYGRWYFVNGPSLSGTITAGKMENPFLTSEMVFDSDYMPEGAAIQLGYQINDKNILKLNGSAWMLDELSTSSNDPYLLGIQARWDSTWSKKLATTAGAAAYTIQNPTSLTTAAVPNQNFGNTRTTNGTLVYDYNPLVADAAITYTLDSFPIYKGAFPIKLGGEYVYNPGAAYHADNYAWDLGVTFGKAGKRGTWDFSYTYRWLGANAQWEELVDDDFSGFYAAAPPFPGPGASAGNAGGTNTKGHVLRLAYSPTDALMLSAKWYIVDLINPFPEGAGSHMNHLMVDVSLKF
jgi:hypothetical protein